MTSNQKVEKFILDLTNETAGDDDNEELCKYCRYESDCPRGVSRYGDGPVYPPCAECEPIAYIDYAKVLDEIEQRNIDALNSKISGAVENILTEFYTQENIHYGDITPEQTVEWEELTQKFTNLLLTLAKQNGE